MEILLNNRKETIDREEISLAELIQLKNYTFKLLVTKVNGKLVKKVDRNESIIHDGDDVMVLHMISGG
jgi:thiamine biosynthesis protein ThiS